MTDYDFKTLNDKEFEVLCADVLSAKESVRFERFKPGRDAGVDGRFFTPEKKEAILQCKHRPDVGCRQLIKDLVRDELPKIVKLAPARYLLAVSMPLSRLNKKAIFDALQPYVKSEDDIYGKEDLNDILSAHGEIERRHYKLWIKSTNVLQSLLNNAIQGRSEFSLEEIMRTASLYVVTDGHRLALERLEQLGAVIITGEPGIGKTTLADHLCLHYVSAGYTYIKISDDLKEAEDVFGKDEKQIFYFDDFLGRNYLEALTGKETATVVQFFRRVTAHKDRHKRFVLTSRSTILNQGKLLNDSLEHGKLSRSEYELNIKSVSELEKAKILYNHIWHSGLPSDFIEELYIDKRYRKIVNHPNFNPRLISYITDVNRIVSEAKKYWPHITDSLEDPAKVWENPFVSQQDDFSRAIVILVVMNGRNIDENALCSAYNRFIALPENQNLHGRREFKSNLRALTGSLLNRTVSAYRGATIDLFNPSIGDFVLKRYSNETPILRQCLLSLYTVASIKTLLSMVRNKMLTSSEKLQVFEAVLKKISSDGFVGTDMRFVSLLCSQIMQDNGAHDEMGTRSLHAAIVHILNEAEGTPNQDSYDALKFAVMRGLVTADEALNFANANISDMDEEGEFVAVAALLKQIPTSSTDHAIVTRMLTDRVVEVISDLVPEYVEVTDAFSNVSYEDYDRARKNLEALIDDKLTEMGIAHSRDDVTDIVAPYDVEDALNDYFHSDSGSDYEPRYASESTAAPGVDAIDDLFQRS